MKRKRFLQERIWGVRVIIIGLLVIMLVIGATPFTVAQEKVELTWWAFNVHHPVFMKAAMAVFQIEHPNYQLKVENFPYLEMHDKLLLSFISGSGAPDLSDVEISQVGRFFQEDIGFVDITERLKTGGYLEDLVPSRAAPYAFEGRMYGVEHALCANMLWYRNDLFKEAGISIPIATWDEYAEAGRRMKAAGIAPYIYQVSTQSTGAPLYNLLYQRGVGMFDEENNVIIDDPLAIETLEFIVDAVRGDEIMSVTAAWNHVPEYHALYTHSEVTTHIAPDWWIPTMETLEPDLKGKWRVTTMPLWEKGKKAYSSWGGTMVAISEQSKQQEEAWEFLKHAQLTADMAVLRYQLTGLLPPLRSGLADPRLHLPVQYVGGQDVAELVLSEIAAYVQPYYQNQYSPEATDIFVRDGIVPALEGKTTPVEALKNVAEQVRKLMQEG